jgi:GH15 family glucan-1,4-alpha-glucosidase
MPYKPIGSYGVIGNMHTAALVATDGSIDWLCYPYFDSPSVFGALLDDKKGGFFRICPADGGFTTKQLYLPDTNVLQTRFLSPDGVGLVTDFMPVGFKPGRRGPNWLIRNVRVTRGSMKFCLECRPAFNYARDPHEAVKDDSGVNFRSSKLSIALTGSAPLSVRDNGAVGEFVLNEGQRASFGLCEIEAGAGCEGCLLAAHGAAMLSETVAFWHRWLSHCTYQGRWREWVQRSALMLKLLTFEPTGAIVASPTCSLPETIGGTQNWDYRYTWIRDAAFTIYALMRIGLNEEASRFMEWIEKRSHELKPGIPLQVMYGIDGRQDLREESLSHLDGYMGSKPVRIGNGAHAQLQLDIYGALMDSVYLYNKYGSPIPYDLWRHLRRLTNWVCTEWREPDHGIWEVRRDPRDFVYSKVMCWVTVDRALRLAEKRSFPADREHWLRTRDEIYEDIMTKGWNEKREAFTQAYGREPLDASNLLMSLVFFLSPTDPRMLKTIDAISAPASSGGLASDSLVYRYGKGLGEAPGESEGTFNMCTFMLVEALTRAGARHPERLTKARLIFEEMLGFSNHLGLFAEETGPQGEALGNFPMAFTHLALISAAFNLNRTLGGRSP